LPRIAAAVLLIYWHREEEHAVYWMLKSCQDIVIEFRNIGKGIVFSVNKFGFIEEEEQKKQIMGMSAFGKCIMLARMATDSDASAPKLRELFRHSHFLCDARGEVWSADCITRYINAGRKIASEPSLQQLMETWEYTLGRDALLDSWTALRSLTQLGLTGEEMLLTESKPKL
jgi:hypothetical protein